MRCNWRRWLWGLIPILLLGWLAVWAERDRVEADLGERAKVALSQAGMEWAAARFEGRDASLRGTAADDADPQKAADLLRGVYGVRVVDNNAGLVPMAENFTWRASRRGQRIRLIGNVPNKAVRRTILGVTKANFPGFEVADRMSTARGVPPMDTWLAGVGFALKQLASLKRGDVSLQALDLSVSGEAEDIAAYRAVRAALSNPPKGVKLANNAVRPPAVSPYAWTAKLDGRQLVMTGYYPSDGAKEQLLAAARTGLGVVSIQDALQPAEGAPQDWTGAVAASVQALGRLENGSADLKDAALTLSGIAADAATAEAVRAALRGALPPSIKLIDQIRAKEPPPPPAPTVSAPPAKAPEQPSEARETHALPPPPSPPPPPQAKVEPVAPPTPPPQVKTPEPPKVARAETPAAPPSPPTPEQLRAKACEDPLASIAREGQLLFQFNSARLEDASKPTLDKLAEAAKTCPDLRIEIGGHASAEGTAASNQRLSLRRARSVADYLVRAGVSARRLETAGYGASQPKAPSDTDENRAKNRRIEFSVRPN
jgi:outer membrane protein OmpA-like peptidoglycan-associated protein